MKTKTEKFKPELGEKYWSIDTDNGYAEEPLKQRIMELEYELAENNEHADELIKQKVQAERERVIEEIENSISDISMPVYGNGDYGHAINITKLKIKLNQLKEGK